MNKEWVDRKNNELEENKTAAAVRILRGIEQADFPVTVCKVLHRIAETVKSGKYETLHDEWELLSCYIDDHSPQRMWQKNLDKDVLFLTVYSPHGYNCFLDSQEKKFDGDIIITDPCYIIKGRDDWRKTKYGERLDLIGINDFMTRETIYAIGVVPHMIQTHDSL